MPAMNIENFLANRDLHMSHQVYHPEANNKAERTVQTIKSLMKKKKEEEKKEEKKKASKNENIREPYLALLNFRACPDPDGAPAPVFM